MKKKQSRDKELKELLKQNPEILMEFLEDWKEVSENVNNRELTPLQEIIDSTDNETGLNSLCFF